MEILKNDGLDVYSWCPEIEDGAIGQISNLALLDIAHDHIAIMPDCHQGYGMPIGGVLATRDAIIPNAVGVDIGCGVGALKTNYTISQVQDKLPDIIAAIKARIPVGFSRHNEPVESELWDDMPDLDIINQEQDAVRYQLGTLGGGNHFIELQRDTLGFVWIMLHSGSRNFGYKIANYYNEKAKEYCADNQFVLDADLAYLPDWHDTGQDYITAMNYALAFAKENRMTMMRTITEIFIEVFGQSVIQCCSYDKAADEINAGKFEVFDMMTFYMDVHHNYAASENHFGEDVWVHRKGATYAGKDCLGIIPGSQGTASYIIVGKGNADSFNSCSHGAGRMMSRNKARKNLVLADEQSALDAKGIIHSIKAVSDLDEAPSAYKNIEDVMQHQSDLVEVFQKLEPMAVIKG